MTPFTPLRLITRPIGRAVSAAVGEMLLPGCGVAERRLASRSRHAVASRRLTPAWAGGDVWQPRVSGANDRAGGFRAAIRQGGRGLEGWGLLGQLSQKAQGGGPRPVTVLLVLTVLIVSRPSPGAVHVGGSGSLGPSLSETP